MKNNIAAFPYKQLWWHVCVGREGFIECGDACLFCGATYDETRNEEAYVNRALNFNERKKQLLLYKEQVNEQR